MVSNLGRLDLSQFGQRKLISLRLRGEEEDSGEGPLVLLLSLLSPPEKVG